MLLTRTYRVVKRSALRAENRALWSAVIALRRRNALELRRLRAENEWLRMRTKCV